MSGSQQNSAIKRLVNQANKTGYRSIENRILIADGSDAQALRFISKNHYQMALIDPVKALRELFGLGSEMCQGYSGAHEIQ